MATNLDTGNRPPLACHQSARLSALVFGLVWNRGRNLSALVAKYSVPCVALCQAALIFCSLVLAWWLRFDLSLPYGRVLLLAAPILILIRLAAIAPFGLLRGWWRYTGIGQILDIVKAVVLGSVAFFFLMYVVLQLRLFPRSVYVLEALVTSGFLAGARLLRRAISESVRRDLGTRKRVIVIGAGFAAQMILREIAREGSGYVVAGCVDDDRSKLHLRIQGAPVLGTVDQLPEILRNHPADEILIAVPSATGQQMQRFISFCETTGLAFKTVPALRELVAGRVTIGQLRDVDLDDLLGRTPVEMDLEVVRGQIQGGVVLVTGAAGSIGSELSRQILDYAPAKLICLDQSETGMFYLQIEIAKHASAAERVYCVADIGDRERMQQILSADRPTAIFHAAAYKHVPGRMLMRRSRTMSLRF